MKLSTTQKEVLRLMASGWELGTSRRWDSTIRHFLQQGGLGRGGETKEVRLPTFSFLVKNGFIQVTKRSVPFSYFVLTEKGKEAGESDET